MALDLLRATPTWCRRVVARRAAQEGSTMALFQRRCVRHANAQRDVSRNVERGDRPCESGLASMELAIFLPVLLLMALAAVQFAQIFIAERHLRAAAFSGARTGTIQNSNV